MLFVNGVVPIWNQCAFVLARIRSLNRVIQSNIHNQDLSISSDVFSFRDFFSQDSPAKKDPTAEVIANLIFVTKEPLGMDTVVAQCDRSISREEQIIYDHFLEAIETEAPQEMLERFQHLFISGSSYPNSYILEALNGVLVSPTVQNDFRYVLNRCCHILINRWQAHPQHRLEIPKLVHLFETVSGNSSLGYRRYRTNYKLRRLIRQFRDTEQYLALQRLARVVSRAAEEKENRQLGALIRRYPFLYEHCLISDDHIKEQQSTVWQLQSEVQHQFELDLSKYATYQIRKACSRQNLTTYPIQQKAELSYNPTLLSDRMLNCAIQHYVGRVNYGQTYRDLAFSFMKQSTHSQTFGAFKDDLYQYITFGISSAYGKQKFNQQLYKFLDTIYPESENKLINDFLVVRTCSKLLNFLVVDGLRDSRHFVFIDLLMNLGPIFTTGLLLRIVLFCYKVHPYLERRFSILFSHYESKDQDSVKWLVSAMETLNVALTTNSGRFKVTNIA